QMFKLVGKYLPPPPGIAPPTQWGDPDTVRARLGSAVTGVLFDRALLRAPFLSVPHVRAFMETAVGPVMRIVASLKESEPAKLAAFRTEYDALVALYFEPTENILRQDYLLTRARKV